MDFTDCDFSDIDLLEADGPLFDNDFLNGDVADNTDDIEENLRVLASMNAQKAAEEQYYSVVDEYKSREAERDRILYPELVEQKRRKAEKIAEQRRKEAEEYRALKRREEERELKALQDLMNAEEAWVKCQKKPKLPVATPLPISSAGNDRNSKPSNYKGHYSTLADKRKIRPRRLFEEEEVIPEEPAYQTLEETVEEIANQAPAHSSTPIKKAMTDFLSTSLPHYKDSGYEDDFLVLNSTIPDESRYNSAGPIDLTIDPKIIHKMQNISKIKEFKQQEIDQMYIENAKISEDITAVQTDANNISQELRRKEHEISKSSDLYEQLNESISTKEDKLVELAELNKSQCAIDKLPKHLQDFARQIEKKKARLLQKDLKIQTLEVDVVQLESQIAGDSYEKIVGIEGRKKDHEISQLEAWLAAAQEKNTEHEENIKDMNKKKAAYYSIENAKQNKISPAEIEAVAVLDCNFEKIKDAINRVALDIALKRGIGRDQMNAIDMVTDFEKYTLQNKLIDLLCKKQEQKNIKIMTELTETKKGFKPKFRDQKAMIQLAEAEKTKKEYVDSIRSLRTVIFNLRKQLNDTTAKAGVRNEPLLRRGLKSMQRTLAVGEANNWQRSYNETLKAEELMDWSCDVNAYKWVSTRPAPVPSVMVPDKSNAFCYLNEQDLNLKSLKKDLKQTYML